jgi:ubiquinone/menaquinone biosynthesis C-methylase UbiE
MSTQKKFIPALKFHFLTPLYDWVVKWSSREVLFKQRLIQQAGLTDNLKILDVGCGTGSLLYMLANKQFNLELHGIDIDSKSLNIASKKIEKTNKEIKLLQNSVTQLPFEDCYFDKIFCSLMFHHLTDNEKIATLKEIHRVVKAGGELHFADWGKPSSTWMRIRFYVVQLLDGFATTNACLSNFVIEHMRQTEFSAFEMERINSVVGEIVLLKAIK